MDPGELYVFYEEEKSPFVDNLSCLVGRSQGTPYNFFDFVRITVTFCVFDDAELLKCVIFYFECRKQLLLIRLIDPQVDHWSTKSSRICL